MRRLEELMEKYPQIPRSVILKTDMVREGIRYTPIMSQIGEWAIPDNYGFDMDHREDQHRNEETPQAKEGWVSTPESLKLRDHTTIKIEFDKSSPYEVRYVKSGRFMLYRDSEPVEEVHFIFRPKWYSRRTRDGTLMGTLFNEVCDAHILFFCLAYCEYFRHDQQCAFCCLTPSALTRQEMGIDQRMVSTVNRAVEALQGFNEDVGERFGKVPSENHKCGQSDCLCHRIILIGGGFLDRHKESDYYLRMVKGIKEAIPDLGIDIIPQALEEEDVQKHAEAGVHCVQWNLEVWDEGLFPIVCPGKAKHVGRDHWIDCLVNATKYFDPGHVLCNFVIGTEMAQPHGFKTMEEGIRSNLEGFEWLMQHGIYPGFTIWGPGPGSKFQDLELPPTEYFLEVILGAHQLAMKYEIYGPTNIYCYRSGNFSPNVDMARLRWPSEVEKNFPEARDILNAKGHYQ